ncbi:hypothetical protein QYF36_012861 [Acer negundo]|nr:hypothetical protein QYF36_012861 [Acer negundo]
MENTAILREWFDRVDLDRTGNITAAQLKSKGNVCLGILNGTEVGLQDLNLIGDIVFYSSGKSIPITLPKLLKKLNLFAELLLFSSDLVLRATSNSIVQDGIPRTAYKGIVVFQYQTRRRIFLVAPESLRQLGIRDT